MRCVCKPQWLYTLVICSITLNKSDMKYLNNIMILSIYKEGSRHLDNKSIVTTFFKNGDASFTFSNIIYFPVELKIGIHKGSLLRSPLFAVVPSEARSDIASIFLYTEDLVPVTPIMEPLGRHVAE